MAKVTEEDVEKAPDVESQEKDGRFSRRRFFLGWVRPV